MPSECEKGYVSEKITNSGTDLRQCLKTTPHNDWTARNQREKSHFRTQWKIFYYFYKEKGAI